MPPRILFVIGTLRSSYGGPVEALKQLVCAVEALGRSCEVAVLDQQSSSDVDLACQTTYFGSSLGNYRFSPKFAPWLSRHSRQYQAVVACGIWQYQSLGVRRALRAATVPYFVFPHGALDPWFKRAYPLKHLKKWLYWLCAEYWVLRDASAVLFRSEAERLLARESFWLYRVREAVVDNGIRAPQEDSEVSRRSFFAAYPELENKRVLLFMSRLHAKKGLDMLVDAFADIAGVDPRLHLVVAGPDQDGLRAPLERRARELGVADRVTWTGMLSGNVRWGAYHASEAFCLPSHSENFGMVVAEALARNLPVLISDKVNIWREIEASSAGFVGADTPEGTVVVLRKWLGISANEREAMKLRAHKCFEEKFEIRKAAERFLETVDKGSKHGFWNKSKQGSTTTPPLVGNKETLRE